MDDIKDIDLEAPASGSATPDTTLKNLPPGPKQEVPDENEGHGRVPSP